MNRTGTCICPVRSARIDRRGFTLIELLTVIVIILVLASIVLGLTKYANEKAARAKTEAEISAISTALESYKNDNGVYPKDIVTATGGGSSGGSYQKTNTDNLDARNPPTSATDDLITKSCAVMYRAVTGDPGSNGTYGKTYYNIPASELTGNVSVNTTGAATNSKYMLDPFGLPFGYSTAYDGDVSYNNSQTPPSTTAPTHGYNPTFDLWSSAGYGQGGKSYPAGVDKQTFWIKNW